MSDQLDNDDLRWQREKRRRRLQFLLEDEPIFGLTPSEQAEVARLKREFEEPCNAVR